MEWWHSFVLGIVEGLTEYLPVSSTGHLLLAQRALGIPESEAANAFAICIQGGAIMAVLGLYFARVKQMLLGLAGRDRAGRDLVLMISAAFLPAAIIGYLSQDWIKSHLFGGDRWGLWPMVAAWLAGGIAILAVAAWRRQIGKVHTGAVLESLTLRMAVVIGLCQCVAMWPGVSRSLMTIVGGLLVGLSLPAAVEFSFLLGVVTLSAATLYDGIKHGEEMFRSYGTANLLIGFVAAWVSAALAVRWMVGYLNRHGMSIFGYYRIGLALAVAALLLLGYLVPTAQNPLP